MIIRQTKTRYAPVPRPHAPSVALSTPAFVRRTPVILPRLSTSANLSAGLLFLKRRGIVPLLPTNHREYHFLRVVDRCPDSRYLFSIPRIFLLARHLRLFPSLPLPLSSSPRRHLFALDFSIFKYRSHRNRVVLISLGRLLLRSFVIPIPQVILPNFDSRRGSIVEHARPSCVIR